SVTEVELCRGAQAEYVAWTDSATATTIRIASSSRSGRLVRDDGTVADVTADSGAFALLLPGSGQHHGGAVPLGAPVILVAVDQGAANPAFWQQRARPDARGRPSRTAWLARPRPSRDRCS